MRERHSVSHCDTRAATVRVASAVTSCDWKERFGKAHRALLAVLAICAGLGVLLPLKEPQFAETSLAGEESEGVPSVGSLGVGELERYEGPASSMQGALVANATGRGQIELDSTAVHALPQASRVVWLRYAVLVPVQARGQH